MSKVQVLLMQAEAVDRFAEQVGEALDSFRQTGGRTDREVYNLAKEWESQSKTTFNNIIQEARQTQYAAEAVRQELREQLRQEAGRLREQAAELKRQEEMDERAN